MNPKHVDFVRSKQANKKMSRRDFVHSSSAALISSSVLAGGALGCVGVANASTNVVEASLEGRIYKTLKIGMVKVSGSLTEKFAAAKEAGFAGIEMNSPGMDVAATRLAIKESGLPVDGTVCSTHWNKTHTSADKKVRAEALKDLQTAIRDTHAVGGNTALLVVGHGKDGPESEIWPRAIENISKALPLCAELGVYIAIENVWNRFLYDHDGDHLQTADKFVKFVDDLNSPWVGMQFDIGNHRKYGSMGDWIRALGKRVVKLDLKGYSRAKNNWVKEIGTGDIDWADVRKALLEINYYGWAAAEVGGGDLARLKQISANMDGVFGLSGK
ncbi:sugar phosphate isomerase/epimerase [Mariniblastus sp.]|nr:sugar phosphate isomerase/epimerase [Mariniblastus sp.]